MNVLIPMAGEGKRFKNEGFKDLKPLIKVGSESMISKAVLSLGISGKYIFILKKGKSLDQLRRILLNLKNKTSNIKEVELIEIDYTTEGPACTALLAKKSIKPNEPLVIANCDQIMHWDGKAFENFCAANSYHGIPVTYYANTTKNSYARLNKKGLIIEIKEKEIISNISLNGIHYWKKGKYYMDSAKTMISEGKRSINGEFYIGPTYNEMIMQKMQIGIYHIPNAQHNPVGTPDDLREYLRRENN